MLSQAVAPFGTPSFANHSVSWMHISNYISPRMARLKYNEAFPFHFFVPPNSRTHWWKKNSIFISELCGQCQSPQINWLVTAWQIGRWPFTDSVLIVSWIRVIISGPHWSWQLFSDKLNTLVRHWQIVLNSGTRSIDVVSPELFIVGVTVTRTLLIIHLSL